MDMREFDTMEGTEKVELLCHDAVLLAVRREGCFAISLFQVEHFYVETYFHRSQFCIRLIRCFENTAELAPYLDMMKISI
jgi:hypothetical protein